MVKRAGTGLLLVAVYLTQAGNESCSGDLLSDSGFDLWCGDDLCSWQVEKGDVRQAPTWHKGDLGVEMVGDPVVISQLTDDADTPCVLFDLVADIEPGVSVDLEMDLYDDGVVDFSERLPIASWDSLSYEVRMPERFQGIRFRLKKSGTGKAVLAQIRARREDTCGGARLAQPIAPLGAGCWSTGDPASPDGALCDSGVCAAAVAIPWAVVCSECDEDADCGDGVCGIEASVRSFLTPYRTCVAAASRGLGELCAGDGECQTGVCCGGRCADCCAADERACSDGSTCATGDAPIPDRCGGDRDSGASCLDDGDCATGRCTGDGALEVCQADGRLCDDDPDCPPDGTQDEDEFGSCAPIGVLRGICD